MKVHVNNQEITVSENCTVEKLLEEKGIKSRAAVWINGKQIGLKDYSLTKFNDHDQIKIIRILGGG